MLSNALFAYGTLMQGQSRHDLLTEGGLLSIAPATVKGALLHLGEYPGLQAATNASSLVRGEYITFRDLGEKLLRSLDEEEGSEYRREPIQVQLANGESAMAWTYIFIGDANDRAVIASGDWRRG